MVLGYPVTTVDSPDQTLPCLLLVAWDRHPSGEAGHSTIDPFSVFSVIHDLRFVISILRLQQKNHHLLLPDYQVVRKDDILNCCR